MDNALDMLMTMRYTNLRFIIIIIGRLLTHDKQITVLSPHSLRTCERCYLSLLIDEIS